MTTAAVVIGRNEGKRLLRCLASVQRAVDRVVYVDSGSSDDSVREARSLGVEVIALDPSQPFTAARGRNAGLHLLQSSGTQPTYIQFIDGDCELDSGWIPAAMEFLEAHPRTAIVCGRRRERFPQHSIYNWLCDREWDTQVGRTKSCGGDALVRASAIGEVGGYNPTLIAGEEPEMCVRLRSRGWEIWRLDAEMALHDADMTRFSQWWKRVRRGGFAAAEGMAMHGGAPEFHGVRSVLRAVFWAGVLPVATATASLAAGPWALALLLVYPLQMGRMALRTDGGAREWQAAGFMMLGKFAEITGIVEYLIGRWSGRARAIIEYK